MDCNKAIKIKPDLADAYDMRAWVKHVQWSGRKSWVRRRGEDAGTGKTRVITFRIAHMVA